jgi:hypothetical protein
MNEHAKLRLAPPLDSAFMIGRGEVSGRAEEDRATGAARVAPAAPAKSIFIQFRRDVIIECKFRSLQ